MSFNFSALKETIRIKGNTIDLKLVTVTGKEGEYIVCIAPSINVSGYAKNVSEAKKSFEENIKLFCEDLMELSPESRDAELTKMGFKKELFKSKNFSKIYVDENGALQGLETGTLKTEILEATV